MLATRNRRRVALMRDRRLETLVFGGATAAAVVHAFDDAFLNRQPGVPWNQHWFAALISVLVGAAAVAAFPFLRPGLRVALASVFGLLAGANGVLHAIHVTKAGPAGSDVTGLLALVAGVLLVALAVWIPYRHRGEGERTRRRRWVNRGIGLVAGSLVLYAFVLPTGLAIFETHKYREPIGSPPSSDFRTVSFASSDGLELSGWYRPSRNGAAVVIVHGAGGDRNGTVEHAALLARHGFGVLVYDARGRGESEGSPMGFGWGWPKDVAGALAFLRDRPDVNPERIGGLGLSRGADTLIRFAAADPSLKAIVADGATGGSFADYRNLDEQAEGAPYYLMMYTAARVLSGASPGEPLKNLVPRISPNALMLIATGGNLPVERDFNRIYADAAREPFELWELPEVNHTAAIRERPEQYESRVVGFFDRWLLSDGR